MKAPAKFSARLGLRAVAADTLWYGLADFIPKGVNFALLPIMTRFLTPADYGILAIVQVIASFSETIFLIGARSSFARYYAEANEDQTKHVVTSTINFQILVQAVAGASLLLLLLPFGLPLTFGEDAPPFLPFGIAAVGLAFFYIVAAIPLMKARMDNQPKTYFIFRVASFVVSSAAILYFVVALKEGAWGSVKGQLIGAVVAAVAVLVVYRKFVLRLRVDRQLVRKSLAYGSPLFVGNASAWLFRISDRVFIQRFRTGSVLGIYHMAHNFVLPIDFLINSINFAWMPRVFKEALEEKNYEGITYSSVRIYAIVLLGLAAYMAVAKPMITIMTAPAFHIAYKITQILLFYYATRIVFVLASHVLAIMDRTKALATVTLASGVCQLLLNVVLIPLGGARGAALSVVLAGVFRCFHIVYYVNQSWPVKMPWQRIGTLTFLFGIVGASIYFLDQNYSTAFAWAALISKLLLVASFYLYLQFVGMVPNLFRLRKNS